MWAKVVYSRFIINYAEGLQIHRMRENPSDAMNKIDIPEPLKQQPFLRKHLKHQQKPLTIQIESQLL